MVKGAEALKVGEVSSQRIIKEYKMRLKMDVSRFFNGIGQIDIYQCSETGYRFYYPPTTSGDGLFYKELQRFPWYYIPWKWEHDYVNTKFIKPGQNVLEVGCGHGSFIGKIASNGVSAEGLELNPDSVKEAEKAGVKVYLKTVEEFAETNAGKYDVVCAFQVLEHIHDVHSFLTACFALLKPNGTLLVSVPNNQSFINLHSFDILNMPPHHMGLWDTQSLSALTDLFSAKLISIVQEPLQQNHFEYYNQIMVTSGEYSYFNKIVSMLSYPFTKAAISKMAKSIPGHTVVAAYRKLG